MTADHALDIVLPAHNEAGSIVATLEEIDEAITSKMAARTLVFEDGSSDGTADKVAELAARLPIELHSAPGRKGYSRAVKDGLLSTSAEWVLCLDSDGQCDPASFWGLWQRRGEAEVVVGWRRPRRDPLIRRILSRVFYVPFKLLFRVALHDPSSPMVLMSRRVVTSVVPLMGSMEQGFWWEFSARCHKAGIEPLEIPINHRPRAAGTTQVYKLKKMPGIYVRHLRALIALRAGRG